MGSISIRLFITASALALATAGVPAQESDNPKLPETTEESDTRTQAAPEGLEKTDPDKVPADTGSAAEADDGNLSGDADLAGPGDDEIDVPMPPAAGRPIIETAPAAVDEAVDGDDADAASEPDPASSTATPDSDTAATDDEAQATGDETDVKGMRGRAEMPEPIPEAADIATTPPTISTDSEAIPADDAGADADPGAASDTAGSTDTPATTGFKISTEVPATGAGSAESGTAPATEDQPATSGQTTTEPATPDPAMDDATGTAAAGTDDAGTGYTVKSGDTLWDIAGSELGDPARYQAIIEANPDIDPANLEVGQTLKLPAR